MIEFDKIYGDNYDKFNRTFGDVCTDEASGQDIYICKKNQKVYYLKGLTDEQLESLMKKSLASGHDYLLDAVKGDECPPLNDTVLY